MDDASSHQSSTHTDTTKTVPLSMAQEHPEPVKEQDIPKRPITSTSSLHSRAQVVQAAHRFTTSSNEDYNWKTKAKEPSKSLFKRSKTLTHDTTNGDQFTPEQAKKKKPRYHWLSQTGKEPGVDVNRDAKQFASMDKPTKCTVVDYSSDGEGSRVDIPGSQLSDWLNGPDGARPHVPVDPNPKAPGKSVRWINIDGINFDTVKVLTLKYNLHPLAIEDALRATANPRSKLDFYASHIYCQILVQHIRPRDQEELEKAAEKSLDTAKWSDWLRGKTKGKGKATHSSLPEGVEGVFEPVSTPAMGDQSESTQLTSAHRMTIEHLSAKYMVPLRKSVLSVFMMRDGTIITMSADPFRGVLVPIYNRLSDEEGILRRTCDVSMLLEALLDVVVDIAIEISKAFESEILKMEAGCLVAPQWEYIRHLHVISSQLSRLKRAYRPLLHVLYTLRDQDAQRTAASLMSTNHLIGTATPFRDDGPELPGSVHALGSGVGYIRQGQVGAGEGIGGSGGMIPFNAGEGKGYVSETTKVYLCDVIDHLDSVLTLVETFIGTCDHLTNYIFNSLSFLTNASMERLSLVTVVFLPLTFLAGYFGMNFTDFADIQGSVSYFWKIAGPLSVVFFLIFCGSYLMEGYKRAVRYAGKRKREEMVKEGKLNPVKRD